ncbi:acyltransferase [Paludisphaera sp.]|uniref:acyltransferase family protein n=1 Tax=Paludisphaera sp. TaxID=2017432 RepID=UPI00301CC965
MKKTLGDICEGRCNSIDFARFYLASVVIFSHSYILLLKTGNREEPVYVATGGQKTGGELAVDGFFILSGFLIARSWVTSRGLGDFMRRRVLRIYPGYIAAALFSGLIAAPLLAPDMAEYWRRFSAKSFLLGVVDLKLHIPAESVNGSLWTIRYEFLCYLAVAAWGLMGILGRRRLVLMAFLLCLACHAGQGCFGWRMPGSRLTWLYGYPGFWPRLMSAFLAGVLGYLYRDRIRCSAKLLGAAVAALVLSALVPAWHLLPVAVPVAGAYAILYLAFQNVPSLVDFGSRGDFSYGIYLYSFPIQRLLVAWFGTWLTPASLTTTAFVGSMGAAFLSWHFIESPFLRRKQLARAVDPRDTGTAQPPALPVAAEY